MPEKSQHPKRSAKVFDLPWESDDEPDDVVRAEDLNEGSDDDVDTLDEERRARIAHERVDRKAD